MYICIHVYMYKSYIHSCIYTYVYICTCLQMKVCICMSLCMHCICIYVHMYTCIYVHIIYTCTYIYIYVGTRVSKKSYHHLGLSPMRLNELWTCLDDRATRAQAPGCQRSSCESVRRGREEDRCNCNQVVARGHYSAMRRSQHIHWLRVRDLY